MLFFLSRVVGEVLLCHHNQSTEEQERPMKVKRKLDGTVDKSLMDQEIRKSDATVHDL